VEALLAGLFLAGYALIALEYRLRIDKAATAILMGTVSWLLLLILPAFSQAEERLFHHVSEIAGILFFLLGAMTIVEVVDSYNGFRFLLDLIRVRNSWFFFALITALTFFLSAIIDNLTATLIMVSLLQKALPGEEPKVRWLGASFVVLAANSGGAWSPLGDVTTTMLWIRGCITEASIIQRTFLPSLVSILLPFLIIGRLLRGVSIQTGTDADNESIPRHVSLVVLILGVGGILSVPLQKYFLHVPPFLAMLLAMGAVWLATEIFYWRLRDRVEEPQHLRVTAALEKIDIPALLFFLGILLAVSALAEVGILRWTAEALDRTVGNLDLVVFMLGLLSSVVDNVPLVAAAIEMYPLSAYPTDHRLWEFLAYAAGVGGNLLIIGSAAGVVAMNMEKIEFFWYVRRISWMAFLGYTAGALAYIALA